MADRILRTGLVDSEAWLGLKDNTDRVCWIHLFTGADTFGNQPGGPLRLLHMWRPYGVDTVEKVAKILAELHDVDLVRPYATADGKHYLHIPRYRQSQRYLGKCWPMSPWTTNEDKQRLAKKSPVDHGESHEYSGGSQDAADSTHSLVDNFGIPQRNNSNKPRPYEKVSADSPVGVGVGVGVGVMNITPSALPRTPADNSIPDKWWATPETLQAKAKALGVIAHPGESKDAVYKRVRAALDARRRVKA